MIVLSAKSLSKSFASRPLFQDLSFSIEDGDRIGLIGPNGAGKSTLLKILASQETPDQGRVTFAKGLRVAYQEQEPRFSEGATIASTVQEGTMHLESDWEKDSRVSEIISKFELQAWAPTQPVAELSGGWRRRVALAREFAKAPGLLLLDEPTNHLDLESILWLEQWLKQTAVPTVTITHDRVFLQRVSKRIIELDRRHEGGMLSVQGNYADFLNVREQTLAAQEKREDVLRNTLRRETEWLRQGAKARTTKQQARIGRALDLQDEVESLQYRNQQRTANLSFQASGAQPKKLIEAKGIAKKYGDRVLFSKTDLMIRGGTRVGLLGNNGSGKSTLIRVLLGEEPPTEGVIERSDQLAAAYFSQTREALDPTLTLSETLCPRGSHVEFRGNKIHIRSYLDRFLFTQEQMDFVVGKLSGGEQSRVLLAQLMLRPANLLVLDEPTNDLDLATLRVLEESLRDFEGAVLTVSHDRFFLEQVSTQILAMDETGGPPIPFADVSQWETWIRSKRSEPKGIAPTLIKPQRTDGGNKKKRLGYIEQREFDGMESAIEAAEAKLRALTERSHAPDLASDGKALHALTQQMAEAELEIERLFARWTELQQKLES